MKHILFAAFFVFSSCLSLQAQEDFRKQAPQPGPPPKIELGTYEQFSLDNGLQVILVENHKIPQVSFQLFIDVPLFLEGEYAGTADLAGQLLRTGTKNRKKAEIDEAVDFIGATFSTNAKGMYGAALTRHRDSLLEVMSDVLLHPAFPEEELQKLRTQTLSGLAAQKNSPAAIASNVAKVLRYGKDHPYGELATEQTVQKIGVEQIRNYYQQYFLPNISYLIIVGDIRGPEARQVAQRYFGSWKRGEVKRNNFSVPTPPANPQVAIVDRSGAVQSSVHLTYPVQLKPGTQELIIANVLNGILGSSSTSRLFVNLREDKGYTYGAYSQIQFDPYVGYFDASADVRTAVTDSAVSQFLYEMKRLQEEPVGEKELGIAKAKLAGSFARALEDPQTIANFALNTVRFKLSPSFYSEYLRNLAKVSARDLQQAARRLLSPDSTYILVVGDRDAVAEKLAPFDKSGKPSFFDTYGNPIIQDAPLPQGLTALQVVDRYLDTIGGRERLDKVEDMVMKMSTEVQGMTMEMTRQHKEPKKLVISVSANGMVMNQQKFDGKKGVVIQGGMKQAVEGEELERMALQAHIFPEMIYNREGIELVLKGQEKIDGVDTYKVDVSYGGEKSTEYYEVATGLKRRIVQSSEGPAGPVNITYDLGDYREVEGIQFPFSMTISGLLPIPLQLEVSTLELNKGIADEVFAVE